MPTENSRVAVYIARDKAEFSGPCGSMSLETFHDELIGEQVNNLLIIKDKYLERVGVGCATDDFSDILYRTLFVQESITPPANGSDYILYMKRLDNNNSDRLTSDQVIEELWDYVQTNKNSIIPTNEYIVDSEIDTFNVVDRKFMMPLITDTSCFSSFRFRTLNDPNNPDKAQDLKKTIEFIMVEAFKLIDRQKLAYTHADNLKYNIQNQYTERTQETRISKAHSDLIHERNRITNLNTWLGYSDLPDGISDKPRTLTYDLTMYDSDDFIESEIFCKVSNKSILAGYLTIMSSYGHMTAKLYKKQGTTASPHQVEIGSVINMGFTGSYDIYSSSNNNWTIYKTEYLYANDSAAFLGAPGTVLTVWEDSLYVYRTVVTRCDDPDYGDIYGGGYGNDGDSGDRWDVYCVDERKSKLAQGSQMLKLPLRGGVVYTILGNDIQDVTVTKGTVFTNYKAMQSITSGSKAINDNTNIPNSNFHSSMSSTMLNSNYPGLVVPTSGLLFDDEKFGVALLPDNKFAMTVSKINNTDPNKVTGSVSLTTKPVGQISLKITDRVSGNIGYFKLIGTKLANMPMMRICGYSYYDQGTWINTSVEYLYYNDSPRKYEEGTVLSYSEDSLYSYRTVVSRSVNDVANPGEPGYGTGEGWWGEILFDVYAVNQKSLKSHTKYTEVYVKAITQ